MGGVYSKQPKQCKVVNATRSVKKIVLYQTFDDFVKTCKERFKIPQNEKVTFVTQDEGYEIEDDAIITSSLQSDSILMVLKNNEKWTQADEEHASGKHYDEITDDEPQKESATNVALPEATNDRQDTESATNVALPEATDDRQDTSNQRLIEHFKRYGLKGIDAVIKDSRYEWQDVTLNIGITGCSGTGKSTLINRLRNIPDRDGNAAKVGTTETTRECKAYPHPKSEKVQLWDIPGVGTSLFPKESYTKAIDIDRYDFFIICASTRFTENDHWLAKEIEQTGKRFYFVRTKLDTDIDNEKRLKGSKFDENESVKKIRDDCEINLKMSRNIFLISNHNTLRYDYPKLCNQLLQDIPAEQKVTLTLVLAAMTKRMLNAKIDILKHRIWKIALASSMASIIPVPGVSTAIDIALILEEIMYYRQQLGLTNESLTVTAEKYGVSLTEFKENIDFTTPVSIFTASGLTSYLFNFGAGEIAEKVAQYTIPVIGTVIASGLSYHTSSGVLESILLMMAQDAEKVLNYAIEKEHARHF